MGSDSRSRLRALVGFVLGALLIFTTVVATFAFQMTRNVGHAMEPALTDQQRLVVNKFVYWLRDPKIGDIVELNYPINPDKSLVRRVIAVESEKVQIAGGQIYVDDRPLADNYVPSEFRSHENWGPVIVPTGYYFVLADHRTNGSDSRHWGFVPRKYIVGKVVETSIGR